MNTISNQPSPILPFSRKGENKNKKPSKTCGETASQEEIPATEVSQQPLRRLFLADYKLKILQEIDCAQGTGEIGAILRREGLFSSHLTNWRRQREQGALDALAAKMRGKKSQKNNPLKKENDQLKKENLRLKKQLQEAETIIELQKKMSDFLSLRTANLKSSPGEES